jgi:hypothetical protein
MVHATVRPATREVITREVIMSDPRSSSKNNPIPGPMGTLAGFVAGGGMLVLFFLFFMWTTARTPEAADSYAIPIAAAVTVTLFALLWWITSDPELGVVGRYVREDDPRLYVRLPIIASGILVTIAYLLFFYEMENTIGLFGMVVLTTAWQCLLMVIVGRHLARRLQADAITDHEATVTLRLALVVMGIPLVLYAILLFFFSIPLFTGNMLGDFLVSGVVLFPLVLLSAYVGAAQIDGSASAFERAWQVLFPTAT